MPPTGAVLTISNTGTIQWADRSTFGGSTTIQQAYGFSATAVNIPVLTLTNTYRGFDIRDSSPAMTTNNSNLFGVFNNAGDATNTYFAVTANNLFGLGSNMATITSGTRNISFGNVVGSPQFTSGSNNIIMGDLTRVAANSNCVILGTNCESLNSGTNVVLGYNVKDNASGNAGGSNCVIIGSNISRNLGSNVILIGTSPTDYDSSRATRDMSNAIAIGNAATVQTPAGIAIGLNSFVREATISGDVGGIAIGNNARARTPVAIAIGKDAVVDDLTSPSGDAGVVIGAFSSSNTPGCVVIGKQASSTLGIPYPNIGGNTVVGSQSRVTGNYSTVFGYNCTVANNDKGKIFGDNSYLHGYATVNQPSYSNMIGTSFSVMEPNTANCTILGGFEVSNQVSNVILSQGMFMVKRDTTSELIVSGQDRFSDITNPSPLSTHQRIDTSGFAGEPVYRYSSAKSVVMTHILDLNTTNLSRSNGNPAYQDTIFFPRNTNVTPTAFTAFYVESIEVLQVRNNNPGTISSQPNVGAGISANTATIQINVTTLDGVITPLGPFSVGGNAVGKRSIIYTHSSLPALLSTNGVQALVIAVNPPVS